MQRYRVNYRLLASLVIGGVVTGGAAYLLWRFQVDRNASQLLARASAAEETGDYEEAFKNLYQYTRLRRDEQDARVRLGNVAVELQQKPDLDINTRRDAYGVLVDSVMRTDDPALRRKLVDVQMQYGMVDVALQNVDELLDAGRDDAKLLVLKARSLFLNQKPVEGVKWSNELIGYDQKADTFDVSKAKAPDQPMAYALLAGNLLGNKQPELARRVVDQMIAVNPESKDAQLYAHELLKLMGDSEAASTALAKAFEIDPDDAGVLSAKGIQEYAAFHAGVTKAPKDDSNEAKEQLKVAEGHLDEARRIFTQALEKYPQRADFYEQSARVELIGRNYEKALEIINRGLAKFDLKSKLAANGVPMGIGMENMKFEILFNQARLDDVLAEVEALRKLQNARVTPLADFHEARVKAVREDWVGAARELNRVKTRMLNFPDLQALASAIQGFCHQRLAQYDLAYEAYEYALQKNPDLPQARAGLEDVRRYLNPATSELDVSQLDRDIKAMVLLPEDKQDWNLVTKNIEDFIDKVGTERGQTTEWIAARKHLLQAQAYILRGEAAKDAAAKADFYKKGRQAVTNAYNADRNDPIIQAAVPRLLITEPGSGPARALRKLDDIVSKSKDSPTFRALRAEILTALGGEDLPAKLNSVTEGIENWPDNQQAEVWAAVAGQFERIGQFGDAERCVAHACKLAPSNLPMRLALFNLALRQSNDESMQAAQKLILEIVKSKDDPDYVLTEVKRRLVGVSKKTMGKKELEEARKMLAAAIKARPTFADLYVAKGQLSLIADEDVDAALKSFDEALERGQANYGALALQIRLLAERGRFKEARQRMDRMPPAMWRTTLGEMAASILAQVGEFDLAVTEAEKLAQDRPRDPVVQAWLAEIAISANKLDVAEKAYKKVLEFNPADADAWTRLVAIYMDSKRYVDVEKTLREAHLVLDEEYLPLLMAKYYELRGRWHEAEDLYRSTYDGREDEIAVNRRMAEFYLTWYQQDDANLGKAAAYVNRILHAANEGELPREDANAKWARRQGSRLLSLTNNYQNSLKAEKLLMFGVKDDSNLETDDLLQWIDVLDRRGDPGARVREIALLQRLRRSTGLTPESELKLGRALNAIGDWEASKAQLEDAIGRYPSNLALRGGYVTLLVERKELDAAERWLARMKEIEGASPNELFTLKLQIAAARGDKAGVRAQLESLTPNLRVLSAEQLKHVRSMALLAEGLGDYEYSLKLMREYSRRSPGKELELARLVALYGDLDEAIKLLKQQFPTHKNDVAMHAVDMLRHRRHEAPEKLDEELGRIVAAALRDDPESANYLMLEAETMEIQEKFDDSIAAYEKVLKVDDIPLKIRATAANNLAFLLAMKRERPDRALEAANMAAELVGPISDILDTRGLAYLAGGKTDEAVADFELAVKTGATPSKYFHLAQALLAAGDEKKAQAAWQQALSAGVAKENISKLEWHALEELTDKLGNGAGPQT